MPKPIKKPTPQRTEPQGEQQVQLGVQLRALAIVPTSFDPETREVDVVFSTGARRMMPVWRGYDVEYVDEELSTDPAHVRLDRLNSGAPVLDNHSRWSLESQIGVTVDGTARMEGGNGLARVRLSERDSVAGIVGDIQSGIIRNISVGYIVHRYEITEPKSRSERALYRAVDWEPIEISFVPVPADAGAQARSADAEQGGFPCIISRSGSPAAVLERNMDEDEVNAGGAPETPATPVVEQRQAAPASAPAAPRLSGQLVRMAAEAAGLNASEVADVLARHADQPFTDASLRGELAPRWEQRAQAPAQRGGPSVQVTVDEGEKIRAAVSSALLHRHNSARYELRDGAENFRGMSLLEMGADLLSRRGIDTRGMSRSQRAELMLSARAGGMHGTSDFASILANVANKTLRDGYAAAPQTFRPFVRVTTTPDFKQISRVQLGDAPDLERVPESGEIKRGTVGEAKEVYSIATYAKVVAITRQTIINDDLGAFTRLPEMFGRAAADLESDTVWGILTSNPNMADGVALFHSTHGNLAGAGAAIDVTSLGAARAAMRKQKGVDAKRFINVTPEYLLVGPDKETEAEKFLASISSVVATEVNPFAGKLRPIAEPRITGNTWFLAAGPSQIDTIELTYLEGEEGVVLEERVGFDVEGIELKARLDMGAKAIDWRGFYKNPGA